MKFEIEPIFGEEYLDKVILRYGDREKEIPAWKFYLAKNRAIQGKAIKIQHGDEIVEVSSDDFLNAIKERFHEMYKYELEEFLGVLVYGEVIFETVFDSEDRFNSRLKIRLTREEFNAVKDLFMYDADCEEWVLKDPEMAKEVINRLKNFERFKALILWAVVTGTWKIAFSYAIDALRYWYYYKERILDFTKEQRREFEKLEFTTVESESSLSGYNLFTSEVARYNGNYVYRVTAACPPDDYAEAYYLSNSPLKPELIDFSIDVFMSMRRIYEKFKEVEL